MPKGKNFRITLSKDKLKFDVVLMFFSESISGFFGFGDLWCRNRVVEFIELVDFYLESSYLDWQVKWSES